VGEYFWRVRGLHVSRENPPWSETFNFKITLEPPMPTAPQLASQNFDYEIPFTVFRKTPPEILKSGAGVSPEGARPFTWAPVEGALSYEVEIARNESFSPSAKLNVGTETKFTPEKVKPGPFFVRVRATGRKNFVSDPSRPGRLDVKVPAPTLDPVKPVVETFTTQKELENAQRSFEVSWAQRPYAKSYELEFGSDDKFKISKKIRTNKNTHRVTIKNSGEYAARVRALDAKNEPISVFSQAANISYRKVLVKPVAPPPAIQKSPASVGSSAGAGAHGGTRLLEPARETSFVVFAGSTLFINMRWKALPKAVEYEVQFATDPDFNHVVQSSRTKRPGMIMRKELPAGKVYWRVRGMTSDQVPSDWSDPNEINVIYQ
jgi:hypothetical protein